MRAELLALFAVEGFLRDPFADLLAVLANLVDDLQDGEENDGNEEEVDDGVDERAPVDVDRIRKIYLLTDDVASLVERVDVCGFEIGIDLAERLGVKRVARI